MSLKQIFEKGLIVRNSGLRPPSRFSTACQQVAVIIQLGSQHQYGGLAIAHIDRDLAPYAEKSYYQIKEKAEKYGLGEDYIQAEYQNELKQGAEALIFNLSTLQSRPGSKSLLPLAAMP